MERRHALARVVDLQTRKAHTVWLSVSPNGLYWTKAPASDESYPPAGQQAPASWQRRWLLPCVDGTRASR
ncbi:hypothetical protein HYPGJ_31186 [Hyphomicrobium sp. GJ21]|nr:hypothetical protein HYPGJ_31186 [Hyphomicrobium sp. GJ21]